MDKDTRISRLEEPNQQVTITIRPRYLSMSMVSDQELETIGSASAEGSLYLALFGVAVGGVLALGITLATVDIPSAKTYAAFWAAFLVSCVGMIYFGILSVAKYRKAQREIKGIVQESKERAALPPL